QAKTGVTPPATHSRELEGSLPRNLAPSDPDVVRRVPAASPLAVLPAAFEPGRVQADATSAQKDLVDMVEESRSIRCESAPEPLVQRPMLLALRYQWCRSLGQEEPTMRRAGRDQARM